MLAAAEAGGLPGEDAPTPDDFETFGRPESVITTTVDVRDFIEQKRASMAAHASQIAESSFFLAMPPDQFEAGFGQEWFIRHGVPEGHRDDDLFAGLVAVLDHWVHTALAQQLVFGAGSLDQLPAVIKTIGARRAMLVTTAGRLASPDGERVVRLLGRNLETTFSEVESHVPVPLVQQAVLQARRDAVDVVVSFGGGSCADLGKAVCFFLEQEAGMPGATHLDRPVLPHVSIPTTYSGAELTPFFGMTDPATRQKQGAGGPTSSPVVAIYDPDLTASTPPRVLAETGMNALAHCVEAAYSPHRTPEAEAIALAGARTIHSALPAVVARPVERPGAGRHARGRRAGRPLPAQREHGRAPRAVAAGRRAHRHPARAGQRDPPHPLDRLQRRGGARRGRPPVGRPRRRGGRCRRRAASGHRPAGPAVGGRRRRGRPRGGRPAVAVERQRRPQPAPGVARTTPGPSSKPPTDLPTVAGMRRCPRPDRRARASWAAATTTRPPTTTTESTTTTPPPTTTPTTPRRAGAVGHRPAGRRPRRGRPSGPRPDAAVAAVTAELGEPPLDTGWEPQLQLLRHLPRRADPRRRVGRPGPPVHRRRHRPTAAASTSSPGG